jgi:hypothetical protein
MGQKSFIPSDYNTVLRMIRVSVFSNDFNASRGWQGLVYIGWSVNPEPSDPTNLNKRCRYNLGGDREPT